jgi:tetratricopeptide (TPR) repeat protein
MKTILLLSLLFIVAEIQSQVTALNQLSPKDTKIYSEAKKLAHNGDLKKSNKRYEDLIKSNPDFIEGILRLATNYHALKDFVKSENLFKQAIQKVPDYDS